MSDLSYLQDRAWLVEREKKWKEFSKRWLYDHSAKERGMAKSYFFDGDVRHLMIEESPFSLSVVISITPINDIKLVIENISRYWHWVTEKPASRDYYEHTPELNKRFLYLCNTIFGRMGDFVSPQVCIGLFHWLYGESYEENRTVCLSYAGKDIVVPVDIDIDELSFTLLSGIITYFWLQDEDEIICIFKSLIPYFFSIYPYMSPICFSNKLPEQDEFEALSGKKYFRKYWIWNRWLLTTMNGFISEYEEELDVEKLVCNDITTYALFKEKLASTQMPKEFYSLQQFVLKHKGESLYASE
jgi:hypothetical protein